MSQASQGTQSVETLNSRLKTWRYQGRFNTTATGHHRLGVTEVSLCVTSCLSSAILKIDAKKHLENTYNILRIHQLCWMYTCLPVTPGLGIALLHWHSRLKTWRCPAKQLHPSSKTFFETKISHASYCSSVMHIGGQQHAITTSTSRMFPFTEKITAKVICLSVMHIGG